MTESEAIGGWLAELTSSELHEEAAAFRRALIARYAEEGVTWETLTDDHIAAAILTWLEAPRPDWGEFPRLPAGEASETATDVRLYLEQFRDVGNRPSTLSADEYTGALRVMRRVFLSEAAEDEGDGEPRPNGFRGDFNLTPKG